MEGKSAAVAAGVSRSNGAPARVHPVGDQVLGAALPGGEPDQPGPGEQPAAGAPVERAPQRAAARGRADVVQVLVLADSPWPSRSRRVRSPELPRALRGRVLLDHGDVPPRATSASAVAAPNTPAPTTIAFTAAASRGWWHAATWPSRCATSGGSVVAADVGA